MRLTDNFTREEFDCKDGTKIPNELLDNVIELAKNLQVIRDHIKMPIKINSGYRSPEYNKKVGGADKSQHLFAKAGDLNTSLAPQVLYKIIINLIEEGKIKEGGVGLYNSFVHYDIRGTKARWDFSN